VNSVVTDIDEEDTLDQPIYVDSHGSLNTDSDSNQNLAEDDPQKNVNGLYH